MYLVYFYVPELHKEAVKEACFAAGAGRFDKYAKAAWESRGTGQFLPLEGATPHIGRVGQAETVDEYRVELVCSDNLLRAVLRALVDVHPYEEPAYGAVKIETLQ